MHAAWLEGQQMCLPLPFCILTIQSVCSMVIIQLYNYQQGGIISIKYEHVNDSFIASIIK